MSDYDMSIHSNRSGKDWAKFFCETLEKKSTNVIKTYNRKDVEEIMTGWFCNAMMAMHDSIYNNEIKQLKADLKREQECVDKYADYGFVFEDDDMENLIINICGSETVVYAKGKLARETQQMRKQDERN